jgi:hypothetical protein
MIKLFAIIGILAVGIGCFAAFGGWIIPLVTGVAVGVALKA